MDKLGDARGVLLNVQRSECTRPIILPTLALFYMAESFYRYCGTYRGLSNLARAIPEVLPQLHMHTIVLADLPKIMDIPK